MRGIKDALAIASTLGRPVPTIVTTGHGDFAAICGTVSNHPENRSIPTFCTRGSFTNSDMRRSDSPAARIRH